MSTVVTEPAVALDASQVASLDEQIRKLGPNEPYLAVLAGGHVYVRSTSGLSRTTLRLWRKHPEMMLPDDAQPDGWADLCIVNVEDL
jgi:hypothetical protein